MDYVAWPERGCRLAEARERVAAARRQDGRTGEEGSTEIQIECEAICLQAFQDNRWITVYFAHPDPAKRSVYDRTPADPIEVVVAAQALIHRWRVLISLLETQDICAQGLNNSTGALERILPAMWSHKEFYLDAKQGDLLQDNPISEGRHDRYIKRYVGIVLQQKLSHVKPTTFDQSPSTTIMHEPAPAKAAKHVGSAAPCTLRQNLSRGTLPSSSPTTPIA